MDEREGNESKFLIRTSRWGMRLVVARAHLHVLNSRSFHNMENIAVHQASDSLALMCRMNGIQANCPGLTAFAHLVVDKSHHSTVLFCNKQPVPFGVGQ